MAGTFTGSGDSCLETDYDIQDKEIYWVKVNHQGKCKVLKNQGNYRHVVKLQFENPSGTITFQIPGMRYNDCTLQTLPYQDFPFGMTI